MYRVAQSEVHSWKVNTKKIMKVKWIRLVLIKWDLNIFEELYPYKQQSLHIALKNHKKFIWK